MPKDQTSVPRESHSGRTSLQDIGKDVCREEEKDTEKQTAFNLHVAKKYIQNHIIIY